MCLNLACVVVAAVQVNMKPLRSSLENRMDYCSLVALACIAIISLFALLSSGATATAAVYASDVLAAAMAVLLLLYALAMARENVVSAVRAIWGRLTGSTATAAPAGTLEMRLLAEKDAASPSDI